MKKATIILLSIITALSLTACGSGLAGADGTAGPDESVLPSADASPSTEAVMIPAQTVSDSEYVEYRFTGTYDTQAMGMADVTADLYYDGSYELVLRLGSAFSNTPSWGQWDYDATSDQFIFSDTDNGLDFETDKNGDIYAFTFDFRGTPIEMTAQLTEKKELSKLHDGPKRPTEDSGGSETQAKTVWVSVPGINDSDGVSEKDGFFFRMYSDHSIAIYITMRDAESSSGTWSYSEETGLELVVDGKEIEVAFADGCYEFVAAAEVAPGMAFPRRYVIGREELEASIANQAPLVESLSIGDMEDRYSSYSDAQWEAFWKEEGKMDYTSEYAAVKRTSALDALFESTLPKEYFSPVPAEARGTVVKFNYRTYTYDYYQTNGVPESEWVSVPKYCYVYLPAGYSEEEQYNAYYLMHGAGGNAGNWFSMNCDDSSAGVGEGDFVALLDHLIANGLMEPTIFVSATTTTDTSALDKKIQSSYGASNEIASFPYELKNDLIPAIEDYFSTYAEDTSYEGLTASRDHRALGGLSLGAYVTWHTMEKTLDVISYFAPLANG